MALLTKATARTLIQNLIDDPAAKLWSVASLDVLIEGALDELWGELLDSFPWLRSVEAATLTPASPGTINLDTDLTRFYRLQMVARDGQAYTLTNPKDILVVNGVGIVVDQRAYTIMGNLLYLFPLTTATQVSIRYNSRPAAFSTLGESATIEWPDGYHLAYCYDIAARALEKGERDDSTQILKRAEMSLFRLKAFLRKQHIGATMPWTTTSPLDGVGM